MAEAHIRLHANDNLLVALADLAAGSQLAGLTLKGPIPRGHKIAACAIATGQSIIRYGQIIGQATTPIAAGDHIHSHNLGMAPHSTDYAIGAQSTPLPALPPREFMGYLRPDGSVGTRNYIGILTSVNCSGSVARFIAEAAEKDPHSPTCPISTALCPSCIIQAAACRDPMKAMTP